MHITADEAQAHVAHKRAGQQACLTEDLKAVADAQNGSAGAGKLLDGVHHGREAGDGSGPRHTIAVKLGGSGDVTQTHLAWENTKTLPYVPTMLARGEYAYSVNDIGNRRHAYNFFGRRFVEFNNSFRRCDFL